MNMTHCLATQGWEWRASWACMQSSGGEPLCRLAALRVCSRRLPRTFLDDLIRGRHGSGENDTGSDGHGLARLSWVIPGSRLFNI